MKNFKTFILMIVFTICCLMVAGRVKAAGPLDISSLQIECSPASIEKGETSTCYYFGQVSGTDPVNGFVSEIWTSDDLVLDKMKSEATSIAEATLVRPGQKAKTDLGITKNKYVIGSEGHAEFQCNMSWFDLNETKLSASGADSSKQLITQDNKKDSSCGIYYSAGDESAFTASALKSADSHPDVFQDATKRKDFAIIGVYVVKLADDSNTEAGAHCGDICIKSWTIPTGAYYNDAFKCQSATSGDGSDCDATTPVTDKIICKEIKIKAKAGENEPTGAFASYAILAAGAFIAIMAVAIAKKNNKLYKI